MSSWHETIFNFRTGKLNPSEWNFCIDGETDAYIMGEGGSQCLACKKGFQNREEIISLYKSLGVTRILYGVG